MGFHLSFTQSLWGRLLEVSLTDNKEYLHQDITDTRGVSCSWAAVLSYLHRSEADIVWNSDGNVEGGQQYQPIPAGFERTIVEEDETGLLDIRHFVLWDRVSIGSKNTLVMAFRNTLTHIINQPKHSAHSNKS